MDAVNITTEAYGLIELRGNKMASIWPIGIDREDLGGMDGVEGQ